MGPFGKPRWRVGEADEENVTGEGRGFGEGLAAGEGAGLAALVPEAAMDLVFEFSEFGPAFRFHLGVRESFSGIGGGVCAFTEEALNREEISGGLEGPREILLGRENGEKIWPDGEVCGEEDLGPGEKGLELGGERE